MTDEGAPTEDRAERGPRDERADRREQRRQAERDRMRKHGARTASVYRDAILKRLRKNAGKKK